MKHKVAIVRCSSYDPDQVDQAVEKAINLLELDPSFFSVDGDILLKPNLLSRRDPERAVTTHPAVLESVIKAIRSRADSPSLQIGDSPGGALKRIKSYWEKSGFQDVSGRTGVPLISFDDAGSTEISTEDLFRNLSKITLSKAATAPEMMINIPKLKTHSLTFMTCAMKNLYGLVPGLQKSEIHKALPDVNEFCKIITLLNKTAAPALHVVDAVTGMEGNGPASGTPRHIGLIIAGTNGAAVDTVCANLIGIPPKNIPYIKEAPAMGIGPSSLSEIEILGEELESVKPKKFKLPSNFLLKKFLAGMFIRLFRKFFWLRPYVDMDICKRCRQCIESCPVKAMELTDDRILIDYKTCITCLCCHELCPHEAVKLEASRLAKLRFKNLNSEK